MLKTRWTLDKSHIDNPQLGNDSARGTIASDFERAERDMLKQEHVKLPEQVQEMIDAIDSEQDRLQEKIESGRLQKQSIMDMFATSLPLTFQSTYLRVYLQQTKGSLSKTSSTGSIGFKDSVLRLFGLDKE
ncbi:hypothetical protein [Pueribacillus theae]|uniref:hypothetical protein n=1 Tax=Pueribacillus theae TaxID=2171751 RepID=UPI001F0C0471|nr:hypothetical protein [Pueribacillus theae]